jgi:predicted membrane GTPase involved in stress response
VFSASRGGVVIDVPETSVGAVIEKIGARRGDLLE